MNKNKVQSKRVFYFSFVLASLLASVIFYSGYYFGKMKGRKERNKLNEAYDKIEVG